MRAPPRLRGGLGLRMAVLLSGLFLFACGIVALLESRLGLSPWDVLHQGLARHTPLSFGEANIAVGIVVLTAAWLLGARVGVGVVLGGTVGVGTVAFAVGIGPAVEASFWVLERSPLALGPARDNRAERQTRRAACERPDAHRCPEAWERT